MSYGLGGLQMRNQIRSSLRQERFAKGGKRWCEIQAFLTRIGGALKSPGTASIAALVFCGNAYAAPPVGFDGWSTNGGSITATCPAGFACIESTNDAGILQRDIRAPDGQKYIQLILSEQAADGSVTTSESFIKLNAPNGGIAAKQTYTQSGADTWNISSILDTGWANPSGTSAIQFNQSLVTNYLGVGYESTFSYSADQDVNGNKTGSFMDIWQRLTNSTALTTIVPTGQDVQTFVHRRASGTRVPSAGSATLPAANNGMGMGGGGMGGGGMGGGNPIGTGMIGNGAGGTITWQAGADVNVTWLGQLCQGCRTQNGQTMGGGGGMMFVNGDATFSYQTFDNLVDALPPIATGSIVSTSPFTWPNPPFGTQPTL